MSISMIQSVERISFALRSLYRSYGYAPYKMNKFESYDLYLRNKEFLLSDRILTFTDIDGKLMALKPDVTLSIIKNFRQEDAPVQKVFYQESVYRPGNQGFREIMQIGLECIGAADDYCTCEVVVLAAKSLAAIASSSILTVSHLGLLSRLLERSGANGALRQQLLEAVGQKNAHEIANLCAQAQIDPEPFRQIATLYGQAAQVLPRLEALFGDCPELMQLKQLLDALEAAGCAEQVRLDLSLISDMNYYNGIVFRGFVEGIPTGVLTGGQYDGLMEKMGRKAKAVGFALYPELLALLQQPDKAPDTDAVLLYTAQDTPAAVSRGVQSLTNLGLRVMALTQLPEKLTYTRLYRLKENEVSEVEANA